MELKPPISRFSLANSHDAELDAVQYWGFFSKEEISRESGRLLMLDIDFGRACSLKCPTCFRRSNPVDDSADSDLTFHELLDTISEARKLGLKTVKICGAGEPFENPDLLHFARRLSEWNIGLSIFTKGHVLGDDSLARYFFARDGIKNCRSLASFLFELKTSLLVSFQSFRPQVQDRIVGNVKGYTLRRNRAVKILSEAGFNRCNPTRLAFCTNPITRENYDELFDIYVYCRERNILPVVAALMVSGKQFNRRLLANIDVSDEEKIRLYTRIYEYNIEHGIQSFNTILKEGISAMPGIHPCNQVATGLYITLNGNVVSCPGDSTQILGNIRKTPLSEIWIKSNNYKRRGTFNCHCPPKAGKTIPIYLYSTVLRNLMNRYGSTREYIGSTKKLACIVLSNCKRSSNNDQS